MKNFVLDAAAGAAFTLGVAAICAAIALGGCSNADMSQIEALGSPAQITCYSGGHAVFDAHSTGKVSTERGSDGWYFEDAATERPVRVSGQCVIRN